MSCARRAPVVSRSVTAAPVHVNTNRSPKAGGQSLPDTRLSAVATVQFTEIPRWYRIFDPLSSYLLHAQTAPRGYRPLPEQTRSPLFPPKAFSEVWGYEIGATRGFAPHCDMLARDGTLCANVMYPGKQLDEAQTSQLMSVAHHPLYIIESVVSPDGGGHAISRARTRCGSEPVAMFVFYDKQHSPVGVVSVSPECSEWSLWPAPKDAWVGFAATQPDEQRVLSQLCVGLDLGSCAPTGEGSSLPDSWPKTDAERAATRRALLPLLLREWPELDEAKPLANTSIVERQRACAWFARSAAVAFRLVLPSSSWSWGNDGAGVVDDDGRALQLEGFDECVKEFPTCSGTVGAARACITRHLEHFWDRDETCHTECVWGIKSNDGRRRP